MTNLAFHNDPALAEMIRNQVQAHYDADEIVQGRYWENGKGCFIGCIAHGDSVATVEQLTGWPIMLTRIAENIFEGLPNDKAKDFLPRTMAAPKIGADLSLVSWKFLHWLVDDVLREYGTDDVRIACAPALEIVAAKARGDTVTRAAARAAADAAAAAAYAAYAAADAAAAAAYAADAAADAAAYAAADAAARERQADKLIELLEDAQ